MDIAESALKNAMPYDEVEPGKYDRTMQVTAPRLKDLAHESAERVAASPEFAYVKSDIERYKKQKEEKTISLNEKKRLAEKKEDEDRENVRKKERAARKQKELVAREITLESIDSGEPPKKSTAAVTMEGDGEPGDKSYEKAPPVPDYVLEEASRVVADMMPTAVIGKSAPETYIP
jgi:hypothetical protein